MTLGRIEFGGLGVKGYGLEFRMVSLQFLGPVRGLQRLHRF